MANVRSVDLSLPDTFRAKELWVRAIEPRAESYEVRVFAGLSPDDAGSMTPESPHYLGSIYGYGFGSTLHREGGAIEFASGSVRRPSTFDAVVSLERLDALYDELPSSVRLHFVTVSTDGEELPGDVFTYKELVAE